MARYEITAPNGKRFEITAPDGATQDEVMSYAQSQFNAQESAPATITQSITPEIEARYPYPAEPKRTKSMGRGGADYEYTKRKAQWSRSKQEVDKLRDLAATDPNQAAIIGDMTQGEKILTGIGAGMADVSRGSRNILETIAPDYLTNMLPDVQIPEPSGMKELEQVSQTTSAGRLVGQAAPFLPAGVAAGALPTLGGRIAASSLVGGTEGAAIASGTGKDPITGALVGAAIGGGAEVAGSAINRIATPLVQKWFGRGAKAFDDAGNPTPELSQAAQKEGLTLDDILRSDSDVPEQADQLARNARRKEVFEQFGVPITEAQRTRDKDLFQMQQDAYKRGGKVTDVIEGQEQKLSQVASQAIKDTGGVASEASRTPISSVLNKATKLDQKVSDLYKVARETAPKDKTIKFNNTASTLRNYAQEDQLTGGLVSALQGYMEKQGMLTGLKPTGRVSVEAAENVRKYSNQLFQSTNDRGKQILRDFRDAVDADTGEALGEDWFKQARAAKRDFESGLDRKKLNQFDERNVNLVRDILNNKVTADDIEKGALFRQGSKYQAQDLVDLKRYLESGDADDIAGGQQAWNDIRAQAMQSIRDKAFGGPITEVGTKQLSRAQLERSIKDIGREKFNVLFNPKEQKFLFDLVELSRYKEPPSGTALGGGPSGEAISKVGERLESKIEAIYGIRIPVVSTIKGNMAERKLLKINDDLADIERLRLIEEMKPYRKVLSATGAIAVPVAAKEESDTP
jgi:hypothetical protein